MTTEISSSSSHSVSPAKKSRVKHKWTDTNTDSKCLSSYSFLDKLIYRVSLHNGGYVLTKTERFFLNLLVWTGLILIVMYVSAFVQGFVDGVKEAKERHQGLEW